MKRKSMLDEIATAIDHAKANPPRKSWFSKLPQQAQEELLEVKRRFHAGEYRDVELAVIYRGIIARCKGAKWETPKSVCTIINWLRSQ